MAFRRHCYCLIFPFLSYAKAVSIQLILESVQDLLLGMLENINMNTKKIVLQPIPATSNEESPLIQVVEKEKNIVGLPTSPG